jgi:hypothetical protein
LTELTLKPWQARNPATAGGSAKEVHQNAWNGQPSLAMQVWIPGEARKQQEMATNKGHGEQELWPGWLRPWLLRRNTEAGPAAAREPRCRGHEDPNPRGPMAAGAIKQELDEHEHRHPCFIHSSSAVHPG